MEPLHRYRPSNLQHLCIKPTYIPGDFPFFSFDMATSTSSTVTGTLSPSSGYTSLSGRLSLWPWISSCNKSLQYAFHPLRIPSSSTITWPLSSHILPATSALLSFHYPCGPYSRTFSDSVGSPPVMICQAQPIPNFCTTHHSFCFLFGSWYLSFASSVCCCNHFKKKTPSYSLLPSSPSHSTI